MKQHAIDFFDEKIVRKLKAFQLDEFFFETLYKILSHFKLSLRLSWYFSITDKLNCLLKFSEMIYFWLLFRNDKILKSNKHQYKQNRTIVELQPKDIHRIVDTISVCLTFEMIFHAFLLLFPSKQFKTAKKKMYMIAYTHKYTDIMCIIKQPFWTQKKKKCFYFLVSLFIFV